MNESIMDFIKANLFVYPKHSTMFISAEYMTFKLVFFINSGHQTKFFEIQNSFLLLIFDETKVLKINICGKSCC